MLRKFAAVILSVVLLAPGWLSGTGFTLLAAFVPLLWIGSVQPATRRGWWGMFGWAALAFVLWNAATVWWIWYATPVGPVAATLASTFLNMLAFMTYHTVSKRAPRALAHTTLVAAWIATEYWYTTGDFSWPWLVLGNGFSHDVWAVQWYEYTGVFGGSLWVLVCNILIFEAWRERRNARRWIAAAAAVDSARGCSVSSGSGRDRGSFEPRGPTIAARTRVRMDGAVVDSSCKPDVDLFYDKFPRRTRVRGTGRRAQHGVEICFAEVARPCGTIMPSCRRNAAPGLYYCGTVADWRHASVPQICSCATPAPAPQPEACFAFVTAGA